MLLCMIFPHFRHRPISFMQSCSLRVQVLKNHILTQNLYYNYYYPKPKHQIIEYLDLLGSAVRGTELCNALCDPIASSDPRATIENRSSVAVAPGQLLTQLNGHDKRSACAKGLLRGILGASTIALYSSGTPVA